MAMITDIGDYFSKGCGRCARFDTPECSVHLWADGLAALRRLCVDAGLEEAVKWGCPAYMHAGRNIAVFGAFRGDFRLNFMNAALLKDAAGVLEPGGPNSAQPSTIRFTSAEQVAALAPTISAYLTEAKGYASAGIKPARTPTEFELPPVLVQALDDDPDMAEAFAALTPGRQRSYVLILSTTKNEATQRARIAKAREKIMAGKGATER